MSLAARTAEARPLGGPRFLDHRFDSAGNALPCAGNTIIRHITDEADLERLCSVQDRLKSGPAGDCFGWPPRASLHCTLFNGLLYAERNHEAWPTTLRNDATRGEADAHMRRAFLNTSRLETPVNMAISGFSGLGSDALGLSLRPDAIGDAALRAYRDDLASSAGLSHRAGHAEYVFHITLGYLVAWPSQEEAQAFDAALAAVKADSLSEPITLSAHEPEFCRFETIARFFVDPCG